MPKSRLMAHIAGGVAIAFGALTIASGGRSLLGLADMGAVVPFVLWFNTLAGPAYILGASASGRREDGRSSCRLQSSRQRFWLLRV